MTLYCLFLFAINVCKSNNKWIGHKHDGGNYLDTLDFKKIEGIHGIDYVFC